MTPRKHVFTPHQKRSFLDILKKYIRIVENKNCSSSTLRAKSEAWENITKYYNASPHVTHQMEIVTQKQLRRLWMNMKHRQKEVRPKERQNRIATVGGSSNNQTEIDLEVAEIAGAIDSDTFPELRYDHKEEPTIRRQDLVELVPDLQPVSMDNSSQSSSTSTTFVMPSTTQHTILTPSPPPNIPPLSPSKLPPPSRSTLPSPNTTSVAIFKNYILEKEYRDRQTRADGLYALEIEIMKEKIKEAKAKAREAVAKAREAEAKAREAEAKAREAEAKAREAEAKAREAEAKADLAEYISKSKS